MTEDLDGRRLAIAAGGAVLLTVACVWWFGIRPREHVAPAEDRAPASEVLTDTPVDEGGFAPEGAATADTGPGGKAAEEPEPAAAGTPAAKPPAQDPPPAAGAQAPAASPPAPATAPKPVEQPRPAAEAWYLQAGAFSDAAGAKTMTDRLTKAGYHPVTSKKDGRFKVWVGPYKDRDAAAAAKANVAAAMGKGEPFPVKGAP